MELTSKLLDSNRGVYLYGTTPPRQGGSPEKVSEIAGKLAARLSPLNLDAINVYDIQDEADRTGGARPFPFLSTIDARNYSRILNRLTGTEVITYKCVAHHPRDEFSGWLDRTWQDFGLRYLALVGGASSKMAYAGPTINQASQAIASYNRGFVFGGVTIAERHLSKGNEHLKLIEKSRLGMSFFTSQVVYEPEATIKMLRDYARECRELNLPPARIILTFCPCGHPKTLKFLKWLGVNVPPEVDREIFSAPSPLQKSIDVCCSTLRQILEANGMSGIPLGVNIESVSIKKDEIDASVVLFQKLQDILDGYYGTE